NAGFGLLVFIMIAVLIVAGYTYVGYRQAATDLVLQRDKQLVVLSAARLREELGNLAENLVLLARSRDLASGDLERQQKAIEDSVPRLAIFDGGVILLDERGSVKVVYPEKPEIIGMDWSELALFLSVFDEAPLFISDSFRMIPDEDPVILLGVPIQDEEGQFSGAIVGSFKLGEDTLSAFYASMVRLRLGQSGTTYIVDGSGHIIYDSRSEKIGRSLSVEQLSAFDLEGEANAFLTEDDQGNRVVAASAQVPGATWQLIIQDDWATLTQSTRRFSNILLLSFAVALALPPLSLAILSRQRRFRLVANVLPPREDHFVRTLRRELQPKQLPILPGWDLFLKHDTGEKGGHDFFDAVVTLDGQLMVLAGHVEGGGVKGALALAATRSVLRSCSQQMLEPREALDRCNRLLCAERMETYSVRCIYTLVNPFSGSLRYANAGQPPFFIVNQDVSLPSQVLDLPMGASVDAQYSDVELHIEHGEAAVLLGSSMMQAKNFKGERFEEAVIEILRREHMSDEAMAEDLIVEYERFIGRGAVDDHELSVLILRRLGQGEGI
ncbi:MAG: SpoIIE family protein phosphatase, partial [Anaerolineales bacterium]